MHPYVSESRHRSLMYLALAAAAIGTAYGVNAIIAAADLSLPWWVETPSVLGFYGAFWKAFDLWLWKLDVARKFGWSTAPDLSGVWAAEVTTSYEGSPRTVSGVANIRQTSSRLGVSIRWDQSKSYSVAGVIQCNPVGTAELIYQYLNKPDPLAIATMHTHRGTAWLELNMSDELEGEYFTGRDRQQWGHIKMSRRRDYVRTNGA